MNLRPLARSLTPGPMLMPVQVPFSNTTDLRNTTTTLYYSVFQEPSVLWPLKFGAELLAFQLKDPTPSLWMVLLRKSTLPTNNEIKFHVRFMKLIFCFILFNRLKHTKYCIPISLK
jgi:hypothetical protein